MVVFIHKAPHQHCFHLFQAPYAPHIIVDSPSLDYYPTNRHHHGALSSTTVDVIRDDSRR